ncbi:MAG: cytochrome b/b6 domain-containing protein [Sandarakinorhabdus sp.]|nr:cytochrome b/b6 domain-containing protein [Sandarakinorhabdus sp.]
MTSFYLGLALALALTLNVRSPWLRAIGSLVAVAAMTLMAWSIILANRDGTFAAVAAGNSTPTILNVAAGILIVGALLILVAIPRLFRRDAGIVPPRSTVAAYGHLTRALHWASAILIIAAFTMGLFTAILPESRPERAEFLATHMAIGGAIFLLTMARLFERLVRPAPPTAGAAQGGHFLLYCLLIAISLTGLALATAPIPLLGLSLPNLPPSPIAEPLHRIVLPILLALLFAAHLGGAVKAIGRMAR